MSNPAWAAVRLAPSSGVFRVPQALDPLTTSALPPALPPGTTPQATALTPSSAPLTCALLLFPHSWPEKLLLRSCSHGRSSEAFLNPSRRVYMLPFCPLCPAGALMTHTPCKAPATLCHMASVPVSLPPRVGEPHHTRACMRI